LQAAWPLIRRRSSAANNPQKILDGRYRFVGKTGCKAPQRT
jgi:hypothetical protein